MAIPRHVAVILCVVTGNAIRPAPDSTFIAADDLSPTEFALARVQLNSTSLTVNVSRIGTPIPGWVLLQGDATAYDSAAGTFYATLSSGSNQLVSSLFALNDTNGELRFRYDFPANLSMGMMAWDATLGKIVGLCGKLMVDGSIDSYCAFDPVSRTLASLYVFTPVGGNRFFYDMDTRALNASGGQYYARLYTEPQGPWMPDNIVTLDSSTGALINAVYGGGPEYAGTRFDAATGTLWSSSNAPGGIDLCQVDPSSGATNPTGAWTQTKEDEEIFAATAVIDPAGWFFIQTATSAGLRMSATDISNADITTDRILYYYAMPQGISNLHFAASDPLSKRLL